MQSEYIAAWVKGLRDIADLVEKNPDFPISSYGRTFYAHTLDKTDFKKALKMLPGKKTKAFTNHSIDVTRKFGPHSIELTINRGEICKKIQVGVKQVEATPEQIIPATPAHEEPIYEWECPKILA